MADLYEVGPGKTYDSASGLIDAIMALPTDMNSVSTDQEIVVYPGYDYDWFTSTIDINPSNPSPSKKIIIRSSTLHQHKGVFGAGVKILMNTAGNTAKCNLRYLYTEVKDLEWEIGVNNNVEFRIFDVFGTSVLLQNLIVQHKAGTCYLFYWRTGSSGKMNNCIGHTSTIGGTSYFFVHDGGGSGIEINNNVIYGVLRYYGSSLCKIVNSGAVWYLDNTNFGFESSWHADSRGNYNNFTSSTTVPGTNPYKATISQMKFRDIVNRDFRLKLDSPLINTGSMNSPNNPTAINDEPWNSNHRSPFNATVIHNIFMQPPEDIDYVRGNWLNGMVLNVLSPGRRTIIGYQTNKISDGLVYSHAGYVTDVNKNQHSYILTKRLSTKKLTIATIFKGPSSAVYNILSSSTQGMYIPSTTEIGFQSTPTSFVAKFTASSYVNTSDFYSIVLSVDLEKSTNSEKIKFYIFQKGAVYSPSLAFSGTAPSEINSNEWGIQNWDYQGITSMWERNLSFEEIYSLLWDPYAMYRNEKKLLLLTNVIKERLLGRLNNQMFGQMFGQRSFQC